MLYYDRFYRARGVRRAEQMMTPSLSTIGDLELPRDSVFHYLPEDATQQGPTSDDPLFSGVERLVYVESVGELGADRGAFRPTGMSAQTLITRYHQGNRKFKPLRSLVTQARDDRTVIVENYALLPHLFRYTSNIYTSYYKWYNIEAAVWSQVERVAEEVPQRHQFRRIYLPENLPSVPDLIRATKGISSMIVDRFSTQESLFISEMWKWLGESSREESLIARVSEKNLAKMNVMFIEGPRWVVINLGLLNEWRLGSGEEAGRGIDPARLQKRFLRMLMSLYETRVVEEGNGNTDPSNQNDTPSETTQTSQGTATPEGAPGKSEGSTADNDEDLDIDRDLEALNALNERKRQREQAPVVVDNRVATSELDYAIPVQAQVDRLASTGTMSAAEYRRLQKLSERYKELPDPYTGKGSLLAQARVTAEDLAIPGPTKLPPTDGVVDQSMLETTLQDFDSRYVEKVLPKDITNMVLSLQSAGYIVTDYTVEEHADVANDYTMHTVKITPVNGTPSTIRFRIPKVGENGVYLANGVKYRLRKQRGDVPIRKTRPTRVALTSYYGKIFVDRSELKVEDYGHWLTNAIAEIGFNDDDPRITALKSATVFDRAQQLPRVYSMLAQRFRSFQVGTLLIYVDYKRRYSKFGEERVKVAESNGMVVMGERDGHLVVVDQLDALYVYNNGVIEDIGKLEELIGLDLEKAPTDVAELKVFAKTIPLGVVLAYYLGIERLLAHLGSAIRRTRSGERMNLVSGEVALRFEDENLIFNREDKLAALLLGGFLRYKRLIKQYTLADFNRGEIYQVVLEQTGLGPRYIRELELLQQLFIDPITRDLLVEMNEPTDWQGLLFRSAELLLTDYSPDETDMNYMRIRGYERMAGAVYGQLVQAARQQTARGGSAKNPLELSPHAVWQTIQEDPSKALVEESNPVQNTKEKEVVTYGGSGGRSRRSMTKPSRIYHETDLGTISESTPDSGDVGINTFMTANPNLTSLRGITSRYNPEEDGPATLLSTSALLSPAADTDDPKRVKLAPSCSDACCKLP